MSRKRLIVNADDLGLAESVNRGIIETMESGVVRSASLMVNMGAHSHAISGLERPLAHGVDIAIGLHFNLVAGAAISRCESLTHPGSSRFLPLRTLALRAIRGRIDPTDVERELTAQRQRAEELIAPLGLRLTHIDSHRHAHCLPGIFEIVVRVARSHGIAHVRHPTERRPTLLRRPRAMAASWLLRAVLPRRQPPDAIGFAGFALMASTTFDDDLAKLLIVLPTGATELMVHPGYDSPELAAVDPYRAPREREVRALTSPALRQRIDELGVDLTHFGSITAPAPESTLGESAAS